jgi:hypothetical protein
MYDQRPSETQFVDPAQLQFLPGGGSGEGGMEAYKVGSLPALRQLSQKPKSLQQQQLATRTWGVQRPKSINGTAWISFTDALPASSSEREMAEDQGMDAPDMFDMLLSNWEEGVDMQVRAANRNSRSLTCKEL